jgi:hypothetical protein
VDGLVKGQLPIGRNAEGKDVIRIPNNKLDLFTCGIENRAEQPARLILSSGDD